MDHYGYNSTAVAGRAIEQTSTDGTDDRFPIATLESLSAANVNAEIRFKAVAGKIDQATGIAVRLRNADNYYVACANALEDNARFYRLVDGRREQLGGSNPKVTANQCLPSPCAPRTSVLPSLMTAKRCSP
jgi:hypothetical protein